MVSLPIVNLWEKRSLIVQFSLLNIKSRLKGTYLGLLWTVLEPLLLTALMYVVFINIRAKGDEFFAMYLLTGIMLYHTFVRGTSTGLISVRGNKNILESLNIRKEFFPVTATTTTAIQLAIKMAVFFALMPIFGFFPESTILLFPIVLLFLLALVLGMSYLLSIIYAFAKDIQYLWMMISFALFFLTPIIWRLDEVEGILLDIHNFNPIGQIVALGHKLVFGEIPLATEWLHAGLFAVGILFFGYFVFQRFERNVVEDL